MAKLKLPKSLKKLVSATRKLLLRLQSSTCHPYTNSHTLRLVSGRSCAAKTRCNIKLHFIKGVISRCSHTSTEGCPTKLHWMKKDEISGHSHATKKGLLPIVCVGSSSCKRYTIALQQLRSPILVQMLRDTALEYGYGFSKGGALAIACEPHTFEATFCLLQRSCEGLTHNPPNLY